MNRKFQKRLIAIVTFIGGLYFFLEFVLPKKIGTFEFGKFHDQITTSLILISSMAIGLGIINIVNVHGLAILRTRKGWINSLVILLALFVTLIVEGTTFIETERNNAAWQKVSMLELFAKRIWEERALTAPERLPFLERLELLNREIETFCSEAQTGKGRLALTPASPLRPAFDAACSTLLANVHAVGLHPAELDSAPMEAVIAGFRPLKESAQAVARQALELSTVKQISKVLLQGLLFPLGAAMFSLLAFYIAAAAYRSFRVRSLEAGLMMTTALIVMLGQIPHGPMYISEDLPAVRLWLLENLSTPAFRAIYFGSAIAGLSMAVRMWLSLEKSPLEVDEDQ